ncbi:MAG TPA: ATP-binding protein [Polyangia bacterium]|nr:ATP-binding protein [Polyangia bacterium]
MPARVSTTPGPPPRDEPDGAAAPAPAEDSVPGASLEESRRRLLDVTCKFGAVVAAPVCAQQIWVNVGVGRWDIITLCAIVGPSLIALGLARGLSYRARARALCVLMGAAAAAAWILAGYVLDCAALHITAVLLAALLLGRRAAVVALAVETLALAVAAYGHLGGLLRTDPQIEAAGHAAENWATGGVLITVSALMLGVGLTIVLRAVERARREAVDLAARLGRESAARLAEIGRREETQRQLVAAQRRDALALLAGGLAHDFNNLLTVVYGAFEQAEAEVRPNGRAAEALALGRSAAESTAALTRQLLAYSRGDPHGKLPTDLAPLVRQTAGLIRRLLPADVELRVQAPAALPLVVCAPTQIQQVLINLAVNARDVMPDGGRIDVTARADDAAVELRVSDTGTGIDPAVADRIFEPLFTTKEPGKGTGLGLSVVAAVVTDHGGTIAVHSRPGEGATFEVRLPRAPADAKREDLPPLSPPAVAARRVLVVDDEEGVRMVAARALERRGFDVALAASADEATRALAADGPPDVVVTDLSMPGTSGATFARATLAAHAAVRVLVVSGYADVELADLLATGRAQVLLKPFTAEALTAAVDALLAAPASSSP